MRLIGTPLYLAPEIVKKFTYSEKSDIYALGIIFYELFEQKLPFYHIPDFFEIDKPYKLISDISFVYETILNKQIQPQFTHTVQNEKLKILMQQMWSEDPEIRPELSHIESEINSITSL